MEEWQQLEYPHERYEVSTEGRVRNLLTGRMMVLRQARSANDSYNEKFGPHMVGLIDDAECRQKNKLVSKLIAETFLPPHHNPHFNVAINKNGDRSDNRVVNLAWRPRYYAIRYHQQFFDNDSWNKNGTRVQDLHTGEVYSGILEAGIAHGLLQVEVYMSIVNKRPVVLTNQEFGAYYGE